MGASHLHATQDLGPDAEWGPNAFQPRGPSHSCLGFCLFLSISLPPSACPPALLHAWPQAPAAPSCMPFLAPLAGRTFWEVAAPAPHPSCHSLKLHPWVTRHGAEPLPSEDENCTLVEVTEEEVENSVKHIPSLATVVRQMNHQPQAGPETA